MTQLRNWISTLLIAIVISFPLMAITGFYPWIRLRPWGLFLWVLCAAMLMLIAGLWFAARPGRSRNSRIVVSIVWGIVPMAVILILILIALVELLMPALPIERDIDNLTLRTDDHFYYAKINVSISDGIFYVLYECDRLPLFCNTALNERTDYFVGDDDNFALVEDGDTIHVMRNAEAVLSYSPVGE